MTAKVLKLHGASRRPMPPAGMLGDVPPAFVPAPEVASWAASQIVDEGGVLHNPDHMHLMSMELCVLWANVPYEKAGRRVLGQAEQVAIRAGGWQKARQELQLSQWFGEAPDWLITLDANYCAGCTDAEFCALVEHELYHIGHKSDEFGQPAFTKEGLPKLYLRGHDVEEFVGVVRRYGVGDPGGAIGQLAAAARGMPSVGAAAIASACGTCLARAA